MIDGYDEWKLSDGLQDEEVVAECIHCGGEIFLGESVYVTHDNEPIHEDCLWDWAKEITDLREALRHMF